MTGVSDRFAANLIRCRNRAGYSQEELGFRASVCRTEVGMLERGTRVPRLDTLVKLAGALEIEVAELIEGIAWTSGIHQHGTFTDQ
jgi:transcriptional regulator with XRE-family HTH domain